MVDADYAANAELFRRPKTSQRLGEFGRVVLRVTVGVNGFASKVELQQSSNFERLDQAAINGAKQLKFRPAMRAGVPVEWTYLLPVNYSESQ
jgi:protein TonB